jgi:molybdenum cofactor cytidylyltransferase
MEAAIQIGLRHREAADACNVKVASLILAGGASRRMGAPKALLSYEGETFLDRLIGILASIPSEVIVVVGAHAKLIRSSVQRNAHFIVNAEWELGQLSSLQCALTVLPTEAQAVLFMPVDCPGIHRGTPSTLVRTFDVGTDFVIPRYDGRRGHPVLFKATLAADFLALPPDASARDVVHRYTGSTRYVDVNDPGILRDIDEPSDYESLVGAVR